MKYTRNQNSYEELQTIIEELLGLGIQLDKEQIYSFEGSTKEQQDSVYNWLLANDEGWTKENFNLTVSCGSSLYYNRLSEQWLGGGQEPTMFIKDLI